MRPAAAARRLVLGMLLLPAMLLAPATPAPAADPPAAVPAVPARPAAATPSGAALRARVDALESAEVSDAAFDSLLRDIDAARLPALKARALVLRCQRQVGADPESMRALAEEGVALARRLRAQAELGGLLLCRGYIEDQAGRTDRALADYEGAIEAATRAELFGDAAQARALRGELLHGQGRYAEGLADMQAAYRHYLATGNDRQQSYALNAIANFYADPRVAQYGNALRTYRQLLAAHVAAGRSDEAATARFNIASTLGRLSRNAEAEREFRAVIAYHAAQGNTDDAAESRRALAAMLLEQGRAAEALSLTDAALAATADPTLRARIQLTRGGALRRTGRGADALANLDAAEAFFAREDNPRFLEHVAGERAEVLSTLGRWREALAARDRQLALKRRLDRQLEQEVTARMRVQFDSERTERENAALQRENALRARALDDARRIRRLQAVAIASTAALLLCALWLAWRQRGRARHMQRLALTDELTGLPNRRAILRRLRSRLGARGAAPLWVAIFDIDHFKRINDQRGHDIGDAVLRQVAQAARATLESPPPSAGGPRARVGRIGGEEFLVLIDGGDAASAHALAERLRTAIEALRIHTPTDTVQVTVSLGGTRAVPGVDSPEDPLKRADLALYRAKEGGRNRTEWAVAPP